MEEWKDIPGYEGLYQVSNLGSVKSLGILPYVGSRGRVTKGRDIVILKPLKDTSGYLFQILSDSNKNTKHLRINRLVAQAFLGLDINDVSILACHMDDNPLNNRSDNLFLGTHQDNANDKIKKGRSADMKGENNPRSLLTKENVLKIKRMIDEGISCKDIGLIFCVKTQVIWKIRKGKTWKHI